MKVLVVGATGEYAGLVVPELKRGGAKVRGLIRDGGKADAAKRNGADETAVGDLTDPTSLRAAAEGCDGVYHINPVFIPNEDELGVNMVEAAKAVGVRKFVFSSIIHPSIDRMKQHAGKLPVQRALVESGLTFTILQPTMFMQTLDLSWKAVKSTGRFGLPYSKTKRVSFVDYRDVAEAAALALTDDKLDYGTFELCSPGMVNRVEVAEIMSEALGRTVEAAEPSFEEWAESAGVPSGLARDGLEAMYEDYDRFGFPGGNALTLRAVLGREPRTLKQYVGELADRPSDS